MRFNWKPETFFSAHHAAPLHALDEQQWGLTRHRVDDMFWLFALLAIALVLRVGIAIAFPSIYHPDETFQYWEQGYRLAFGNGVIPWEYRTGIRSWIVPGFIAGIMSAVENMSGNSTVWRVAIQFILAASSLSIVATAFLWARRLSGTGAAILAGFVTSIWFEFIYFSAKPLTEVIAAALLFPAAYMLCASDNPSSRARIVGGGLLGLAFVLRFHTAPMIMVIGVASMLRSPWPRWTVQVAAAALIVLASAWLDWQTLGSPLQSIWKNFTVNVINDKASTFGESPVFWYLMLYANAWPGFVVPMLAFILVGTRRAPLLFLAPLALLLSHSLIAHKEYRFLYPTLPFVLTLASVGASELFALCTRHLSVGVRRNWFFALAFGWLITSASLAAHNGFRPNFIKDAGSMRAFEVIRDYPKACGVAYFRKHWAGMPGYAVLQRDIPIYLIDDVSNAHVSPDVYNVIVYREFDFSLVPSGYHQLECQLDICVAVREGSCADIPAETINQTLERFGQ